MLPTTERWFHGDINGVEAAKLVREKGVIGSFLVRSSQSKIGDYALTVRIKKELSQADDVEHVKIRHHNTKYDVGVGGERFNSLTELIEHYRRNQLVLTNGTVINMKYPFNTTSITALAIDARINELSKENPHLGGKDGFWEEFEHIQHQECKVLFDRKVGQEDRNILKNRYRNILPYDYTRVILKKPISFRTTIATTAATAAAATTTTTTTSSSTTPTNNQQDSDYINANYIKLKDVKPVTKSKTYIAAQGPLPNTINDFWLMVWQEKSDCIVMVTKEMERGKNKCSRYWPTFEQGTVRCGPIEVKILNEVSKNAHEDEYTRRDFELRYLSDENNDCRAVRRVVQYQYYAWPDQHTPSNPASILSFLDDINRHQPAQKSPLIVHCSAGIGRSGAVIVIDMLIDQLKYHYLKYHNLNYPIDIQHIVENVRRQRPGLVQTEAQYKFIYLAIQCYINETRTKHSINQIVRI